jgi:CIC family chloride channel protein
VTGRPGEREGLFALALISLAAGAAAGFVGALFRLALAHADGLRDRASALAQAQGASGLLVFAGAAALCTAFAAWLVLRFAPVASGSGIPHVESVLDGEQPPAPAGLVPVKFVGGVLAIGSGLALGREGPSVQMGASLAHLLARGLRRSEADCRALLAAGAGAGLATAFNAPIAGAVFVLEELVRRFDPRTTVATFGASAGAIAVSRVLLGEAPDFAVAGQSAAGLGMLPLFVALGVFAGVLGVAYNRTLLGTLALADRLHLAPVLRATAIGASVGVLGWLAPGLVGGGDPITQRTLEGRLALEGVALAFLLRFALGPASYAAGTPGGLFAPLLVLGAQCGQLFAGGCAWLLPGVAPSPIAGAVVGMAAFFTAVVRAPLTGIVLVVEMTGSSTLLLPMLGACFAAMGTATWLRDAPIYDALRVRAVASGSGRRPASR